MNFTKNPPTEPGFYWWRAYRYKSLSLWRVWDRWCRRIDLDQICEKQNLQEMGGEWYGPLEIPYPENDTEPCQ